MANEIFIQATLSARKLGKFIDSGTFGKRMSMTGQNMLQDPQFISTAGGALSVGLIAGDPKKFLIANTDPVFRFLLSAVPTITSGGAGYSVGNVLTIPGNASTDVGGTVTVSTVAAGVITGITLTTAGSYTTAPPSPATPTGGGGAGAILTLTSAATLAGNNVTLYGNNTFTQTQDVLTPGDVVIRSPGGTIYAKATTAGVWLATFAVEA